MALIVEGRLMSERVDRSLRFVRSLKDWFIVSRMVSTVEAL